MNNKTDSINGRFETSSSGDAPSNGRDEIVSDNKAVVRDVNGITVREEIIMVRGEKEPFLHLARDTDFGPIISDHFTPIVTGGIETVRANWRLAALSSQALMQSLSFKFLFELNTASNFNNIVTAGESLRCLALNIVYVDKSGNMGQTSTGR